LTKDSESISRFAEMLGVFLAGGLGASLRMLLSSWLEDSLGERLPFSGVLVVNLLGCLLIGFASAAITTAHWRNIVLGGALGGFTTYSAFALFTVTLAREQRTGVLLTQVGAHLIGGVLCVWAGFALAKALDLTG